MMTSSRTDRGFSLLELMAVVGVISILLGFLLPALQTVARHSRKVTARHEVRMLAAAFVEYYNTYSQWPVDAVQEDGQIGSTLAAVLQGIPPASGISGEDDNPYRLNFVDFSRLDGEGNPVNPWARIGGGYRPYYYVRFDREFNNSIDISDLNISIREVPRQVVVWTYNPHVSPSADDYVIGSWQE